MESTVPSPAVELPRPGDVICNKYRIEEILGQGGMGVVMAATDTTLARPVAIKFLLPGKASREDAAERFLREARAAAAIQSEHVVRVFEVDTLVGNMPFIVMERLTGLDLAQTLEQRGPLPIDEACDWIIQACQALGEAHARGFVHRDLKPGNLFLARRADGTSAIKVLDFGISKAASDTGATELTSTGTVMGTPQYMSPEQVRSLKNVDARTDIWALGSILFELLTNSAIFEAPTASALCAMIAMDPPIPLRLRRPTAPAELEAVILRCLHKDPMGRFPDVAVLAESLAPFASQRGRMSVDLVSAVVRGSAVPPGLGPPRGSVLPTLSETFGTTMGPTPSAPIPPHHWPSAPPSSSPSGPPYRPSGGPIATTQDAWQQPAAPPEPLRARGAASVGLVGLVGLVVVSGAAFAGYTWVKAKAKERGDVLAVNVLDAGGPALAVPPGTSAASGETPSATSTSTSTVPPNPAFTPAPPLPKPPSKEEQARLAGLARQAEVSCHSHTNAMNRATTDAAHKRAAEEAKTATCRGMSSSRCERTVCLNACNYLHDQACVQQIDYMIEKGPPPKY